MKQKKPFLTLSMILLSVCIMVTGLSAQEVENIDGVRVVHNSSKGIWGSSPEISLKHETVLGLLDADDENYMFYMPNDIVADSEGNLYVLDSGNHRIQKFDKNGQFLATYGEEGQGPGEFTRPLSIDLDLQGNMYIIDQGNSRLQILSPDGRNSGTLLMDSGTGVLRLLSTGDYIMTKGGMMMAMGADLNNLDVPPVLFVINSEGEQIRTIGEPLDYKNFLTNRVGNSAFYVLDDKDNVFITFEHQNRIEKYSPDGKLLLSIDRDLNYDVTEPDPDEDTVEQSGGRIRMTMPQLNDVARSIDIDNAGRIWVITNDRQIEEEEQVQRNVQVSMDGSGQRSFSESLSGATDLFKTDMYKLEIYSPEGVLLTSIPLDHFCDNMKIINNKVYIADMLRGMQFHIYSIEEM